jgi:hypothetical protein
MATTPPALMRHRSFYLADDDMDRLACLVDDVHHSLRRPKWECWRALVAVAAEHRAEIEARLSGGDQP